MQCRSSKSTTFNIILDTYIHIFMLYAVRDYRLFSSTISSIQNGRSLYSAESASGTTHSILNTMQNKMIIIIKQV